MRTLFIGLATIFALSGLAHAQESDEQARHAFESGREAFSHGDYETALTQFRVAYELSQRAGLLYNIGQSLDRLRRDEEALQVFRQYLEQVPASRSRAEVEARIRVLDETITRRRAEEATRQAEAARLRELQERAAQTAQQQQQDSLQARSGESQGEDAGATEAQPPPLHPALFIVAAALAAAAGGVAIWTGLEAQSRLDPYMMSNDYDTATVLYEDGVMYQSLTTGLLIGGGAVAIAAVVMAFFTDWGGGSASTAGDAAATEPAAWLPTLEISPNGGTLGAVGQF